MRLEEEEEARRAICGLWDLSASPKPTSLSVWATPSSLSAGTWAGSTLSSAWPKLIRFSRCSPNRLDPIGLAQADGVLFLKIPKFAYYLWKLLKKVYYLKKLAA